MEIDVWTPNKEIIGDGKMTGSTEVTIFILHLEDQVSLAQFTSPQAVKITNVEIPVDFVFNVRQYNGYDSCGWHGIGFLNKKIQYKGFTTYDKNKREVAVLQPGFLDANIETVLDLKATIRKHYREGFDYFEEAIKSLPNDFKNRASKLLI